MIIAYLPILSHERGMVDIVYDLTSPPPISSRSECLSTGQSHKSQLLLQFNAGQLRGHGIPARSDIEPESLPSRGDVHFDRARSTLELVTDIRPGQVFKGIPSEADLLLAHVLQAGV